MMRAAAWLLILAAAAQAQVPKIDWAAQRAESLAHFRALIQLDTSNPPGNETLAVDYLRKVLEAEGIPTKTFALDPKRANLVARIKGNGSKRPLLILAHTDVVGVQREKWPVDPFGAVLKDGYVWGRGAVDDKPILAANLMTMLLLKRTNAPLDRDVIFLAESGEEADTTGVGINFMVNRHFDEIDAEFALTEVGGATIENGKVKAVYIGTAEKLPARTRIVATGPSGHGSAPRVDNALVRLSDAVSKLAKWETPVSWNDTTRAYFEKLATISAPEDAARYKALLNPRTAAAAIRWLAVNDPRRHSMLRTTISPTILKAGIGINVIPSAAEATLDIRVMPGEDLPKFWAEMAKVIGDPSVKIEPLPMARPPSPPSRLDTEMYRIIEQVSRRRYPGAPVLPAMSTGASDKAQLRAKGIQSYGIGPASTDDDATNYGAHSDVERLAEPAYHDFVEFTWELVTEVSVRK
jgi:acetylornithine deacetylase/succinyl-diaminopimelate desuccinylase-like protein